MNRFRPWDAWVVAAVVIILAVLLALQGYSPVWLRLLLSGTLVYISLLFALAETADAARLRWRNPPDPVDTRDPRP